MVIIYTDESVSPSIARGLRRRNIKAIDVREEGKIGLKDKEQLEFAKSRGFIIFTHDDDFIRLVEKEDLANSGIIYCDQRKYSIGEIIRKINLLLDKTPEENLKAGIHYI